VQVGFLPPARRTKAGPEKLLAGKWRYKTNTEPEKGRPFDFQGYAYRREISDVSCQKRILYDLSQNEVWKVRIFDELEKERSVRLPQGGYIVPAAHAAWVSRKLALHGIRYDVIERDTIALPVEIFPRE
jgi:hypothetical protein